MKRLHVGSGRCILPQSEGWTNCDLFDHTQADVYADMTALPFERESFDLLYCGHCLEHVHRRCVLSTLAHWKELLKPGGTLRIAVPDFEACCEWYNKTKDLKSLIGLMFGGQTHPRNTHHIIFDRRTLTEALDKVGFINVRTWDWRTTDHAKFDDYSQAYLPTHLDKVNGMLVSLNLEATKPHPVTVLGT